jgi:fatty-acyl-CoA synthase
VRRRWRHADKTISVDRDAFNCNLTILDGDGNSLPIGETGEVAARGDRGMTELVHYCRFDGWLYTGNIGWLDADEFFDTARPIEGHHHRRWREHLVGRD